MVFQIDLFLVINKILPEFDPDKVKATMEKAFEVPVKGILPLEADMIKLGSRDVFCLKYPDHPLSVEIRRITAYIG